MALLLFVTACAASTSPEAAPTPSETRPPPTQTRLQPAQALPKNILVGRKYSHVLYTHCGIWEARFAGQYWVTTPELHDGAPTHPQAGTTPNNAARSGCYHRPKPSSVTAPDTSSDSRCGREPPGFSGSAPNAPYLTR